MPKILVDKAPVTGSRDWSGARARSIAIGVGTAALATLAASTSSASAPRGRYTIANGAVYDTKTKLTWQQAAPTATYAQPNAITYCAGLALGGARWRLPTVKELVTIVDYTVPTPGPTVDVAAFPNTPAGTFWASTPFAVIIGPVTYAWNVDFTTGVMIESVITTKFYVRCVR